MFEWIFQTNLTWTQIVEIVPYEKPWSIDRLIDALAKLDLAHWIHNLQALLWRQIYVQAFLFDAILCFLYNVSSIYFSSNSWKV